MIKLEDYGIQMWKTEKIADFRTKLLAWYDENKRDLPWRRTNDPYKIWVSEIMLQQTRVDTVIPYYERFLDWFPTVTDLALAQEDTLLKAWEGLGYYSRVRNMQTAAQQVMADFDGDFPNTYKEIASLKGIGPYTAGAISSIAFNLPEPAVDGNVMRVLARLFEVNLDIGIASNRKVFQKMMEILIDPDRPGDFNQALMDLGSDIEAPVNPRPEDSPVREFSAAYQHGTMDIYPIKAPKKKPTPLNFEAFLIRNEKNEFLLEKKDSTGLLSGFWSFPLLRSDRKSDFKGQVSESEDLSNQRYIFESSYLTGIEWEAQGFSPVIHIFSHQKWTIQMNEGIVKGNANVDLENCRWVAISDFASYPFAKPQQKMWETYLKEKQYKK